MANSTLLTSREVILAKQETTYNSDSAPTASANAILVSDPSWSHEGLRMIERNIVKNTDGANVQVFGGTLKTVSFSTELKGSGTAGVSPDLGVLFTGCSYKETITASTSVDYQPSSTSSDKKSLTIWYYQDGLLHKITGARGTFTIACETGAIPMATFTFTGHSVAPIDAALVTPTIDATVPVAVKNAAFTIGGFAAIMNAFNFDSGVAVSTPPNMSAVDGFGEVYVGARDCNGSIDPQSELVANNDFYGDFLAGTSMALTTGAIGSTAGNILTITMPAVSYRDATPGDRDGIRTYELPFGAAESSGDDEVKITFT